MAGTLWQGYCGRDALRRGTHSSVARLNALVPQARRVCGPVHAAGNARIDHLLLFHCVSRDLGISADARWVGLALEGVVLRPLGIDGLNDL